MAGGRWSAMTMETEKTPVRAIQCSSDDYGCV